MSGTINYSDLSPELVKLLEDRFSALQTEIEDLKEKQRKKAKKEFTDQMKLEDLKRDFIESNPESRTDPFTNWELVFWAGFVLSNTNRREKIDSIAEVAKRGYRIQGIVDFFKESYDGDDEIANAWARNKTKYYLEYVLLNYPTFTSKGGATTAMTFYVATSDWAVNNWHSRVSKWVQERSIEDKPA